jgi:hypothetical protein
MLINKKLIINIINMDKNTKTIECIKISDLIKEICKTPQFRMSKNYDFIMEDKNKKRACSILLKNIEICNNELQN